LDVFVIGGYDRTKIKEISKTYKIEINIKNYPKNVFKKTMNHDILIQEVLKDHVIFLNSEEFINLMFNNLKW
jgi:hypothetical protein